MIYLDHASTTYVYPECIKTINFLLEKMWGNPSNLYSFGNEAKAEVDLAKQKIASCINCSPDEIFFTSGSSEGNSWGLAQHQKALVSPYEHHSILNKEWSIICDDNYLDRCEKVKDYMVTQYYQDTYKNFVYAHMLVSNETGEVFNVNPAFNQAHRLGMFVLCDMTQAFGNMKLDIKKYEVDMAVFSGHKFHAPKGIGFVYIPISTQEKGITPLVYGNQQNSLRGGTENVPYIAAMGDAAIRATKEIKEKQLKSADFNSIIYNKLINANVDFIENKGRFNIFSTYNIALRGVESEIIQAVLSDKDIFIGVGSGCNNGLMEDNATLKEMKVPPEYIRGPIRFSYALTTEKEEVIRATDELIKVYRELTN